MKRLSLFVVLMLLAFATSLPAEQDRASAFTDITFRFDEEISAEDRAYIREGIILGQNYFRDTLHVPFQHPLIVNAHATSAPASLGEVAEATDGYIAFFTGSTGWIHASPAYRVEVAIHELVHVLQGSLLGHASPVVPHWIIEGSSEFLAGDAVVRRGIIDQSDADAFRYWSIGTFELDQLSEYESQTNFRMEDARVYALSYLGVSRLANIRGAAAIVEFFESVGEGAKWQDAFWDAFGVTPADFYQEFETERADFPRPAAPPDSFVEVHPVNTVSPVHITSVPKSVSPGHQLLMTGHAEPNARCITYLWGQSLDLAHETTADAGARLFWLVTIPESTPEQRATMSVDCGAGPELVAIQIQD